MAGAGGNVGLSCGKAAVVGLGDAVKTTAAVAE